METKSSLLRGEEGVTLRRVTSFEEFAPLFPLYEMAFPQEERRDRDSFSEVFLDTHAEFWFVEQRGEVQGFLNTWRFEECLYGEHFAVFPEARGNRIGEHALRVVLEHERLPILIEIEPPEDEIKMRRKAFYERMGLRVVSTTYQQPPYAKGGLGLPLYLMSNHEGLHGERLSAALRSLASYVYRGADVEAMMGGRKE